ncbi:MAG: hypothetical protein ACTSWN_00155 [Promethearchaeota archaeon]
MGSRFHELINSNLVTIDDLTDKVVAIDATTWLYQLLKTKRKNGDGRLILMDKTLRLINHLRGFLYRTLFLLEHDVWPIFVFDGRGSRKIRNNTLKDQAKLHNRSIQLRGVHDDAMQKGLHVLARNIGCRFDFMFFIALKESKRLLEYLGMPVIIAPGEGEAQCSSLVLNNTADAVVSPDIDAILYGAANVYKKVNVHHKKNVACIENYTLKKFLEDLGLNQRQLVDLALLVGTDYNKGIRHVGPRVALDLLLKYDCIEDIALNKPDAFDWSPFKIKNPARNPASDFLDSLRDIFLKPVCLDINSVQWQSPNPTMIRQLLLEEHGFSQKPIEKAISRLISLTS